MMDINRYNHQVRLSPDFSPGRWLLSETYLLSISYGNIFNIPPLQTALDAPSLVFVPPAGTCSLNRSYGYAFGPRIKYGAGSGTRWRHKSCAIIASPSEKTGLVLIHPLPHLLSRFEIRDILGRQGNSFAGLGVSADPRWSIV